MSETSRARFVQRHTDLTYQQALESVRAQWRDARVMQETTGWSAAVCHLVLADSERGMMHVQEELYTEIHRLLMEGEYRRCNALLGGFECDKYPSIVGIGILRAAFPVRESLSAWAALRDKLAIQMERHGENLRLMRGLLDNT